MGFHLGCPLPYLTNTKAKLPVPVGELKEAKAIKGSVPPNSHLSHSDFTSTFSENVVHFIRHLHWPHIGINAIYPRIDIFSLCPHSLIKQLYSHFSELASNFIFRWVLFTQLFSIFPPKNVPRSDALVHTEIRHSAFIFILYLWLLLIWISSVILACS